MMTDETSRPLPFPGMTTDEPGSGDIALILREDGAVEVFVPGTELDEERGTAHVPIDDARVISMMAVGSLLGEDKLMEAAAERVCLYLKEFDGAVQSHIDTEG